MGVATGGVSRQVLWRAGRCGTSWVPPSAGSLPSGPSVRLSSGSRCLLPLLLLFFPDFLPLGSLIQVHLPGLKPPGNSTSPDCPPQQQDCHDQQQNFLLPQQLQNHLNQRQQFLRCLCHAKLQVSFARTASHVSVPPKYATVLWTVLDTSWERAVRMRTIVLLAVGRGSSISHRSWSPSLQDQG